MNNGSDKNNEVLYVHSMYGVLSALVYLLRMTDIFCDKGINAFYKNYHPLFFLLEMIYFYFYF